MLLDRPLQALLQHSVQTVDVGDAQSEASLFRWVDSAMVTDIVVHDLDVTALQLCQLDFANLWYDVILNVVLVPFLCGLPQIRFGVDFVPCLDPFAASPMAKYNSMLPRRSVWSNSLLSLHRMLSGVV